MNHVCRLGVVGVHFAKERGEVLSGLRRRVGLRARVVKVLGLGRGDDDGDGRRASLMLRHCRRRRRRPRPRGRRSSGRDECPAAVEGQH